MAEVSRFGVKLYLLRWLSGYFDGAEVLIPWHRIMQVQWADQLSSWEAEKQGYGEVKEPTGIYDCDPLAYVQTKWTHGTERAKEDARAAATRRSR